jgi:hypothetical protein
MISEERMEDNSLAQVMKALDSPVRRMIMLLALETPKTSQGYKEELLKRGLEIKYKESIYKDLQLLVEAGLIQKYYDKESKTIVYGSRIGTVVFDLMKWSLYLEEAVYERSAP